MKKALILFLFSYQLIAQESKNIHGPIPAPPTPMEVMLGNNRANLLIILSRPIDEKKKFSFFNVTVGASDYQNNPAETDMVINNALLYNLGRNFYAGTGLQWNYKVGLVPSLGLQYFKASPDYLVVIFPSYNMMPNAGLETVALAEVKPRLSEKTRLYTRIQGLYVQDLEHGVHAKSAVSLRAGLSFGKYTFGLGTNADYYGPMKFEKLNTGVFLQLKL